MKFNVIFVLSFLLLVASCSKSKEKSPYTVFKNSNYKEIKTSEVEVNLNDSYYIFVESGYDLSNPRYSFKKNNETPYNVNDSSFVKRKNHGWNGKEGLDFEKMIFTLSFDSNEFEIGDKLKLTSVHNEVNESLTFEVK